MACVAAMVFNASAENAGLEIGTVSAAVGAMALLPATYTEPETHPPATLLVHLTFPAAHLQILSVLPGDALDHTEKTLDFEVNDNALSIALFGGASSVPDGVLFQILIRIDENAPTGASLVFLDAGTHGADGNATHKTVDILSGAITILETLTPHRADVSRDWSISLPELLRIIQFYNARAYHCAGEEADGYAPGMGNQDCAPHDADYAPVDWRISFTELLRMIQLYNAPHGAYHRDAAGEDRFAPGPFGYAFGEKESTSTKKP